MADFKRICSYKLICHSIGTESTMTDSESTSESSTMSIFMPFVVGQFGL